MVSLFNFVIGISADPTLPQGACMWPQGWVKDFSNLLDIVRWVLGRGSDRGLLAGNGVVY
jgi:hypothetical protein